MFKIGEFAKITQVSIRMLRYYDEQKILVPQVIDPFTGYRFYAAKQIDDLNRIILLRDMGFGIKDMRQMLKEWNPDLLKKNLLEQMEKTKAEVEAAKNRLRQMQGYLEDLDSGDDNLQLQIVMKSIPAKQVVSLRKVVADYYQEEQLWRELGVALADYKVNASTPSFSVYHDLDDREQDVDIEVCLEREPIGLPKTSIVCCRQIPAVELAACFMIYGPYSNISKAYKQFAYWLEQHTEYRMAGENRQICHVSACHTDDPQEYITEMQIPLTKA